MRMDFSYLYMILLNMITDPQYKVIKETLSRFRPTLIGIFGSYARNEQTKDSDLDILVSFRDTISLLDLIGLEQELSDRLGITVDLLTERSVHPKIKKYIEEDLIILE